METSRANGRFLARPGAESPAPDGWTGHLRSVLAPVWLPFITSRVVMFGSAWLANTVLPYGRPGDPLQYPAPWRLWLSWDAVHYLTIARAGYPAGAGADTGYLPLLPGLIHLAGGSEVAALGLSLGAGFAGLAALGGLTDRVLGAEAARRTAWVAAWWPLGFVWSAVYTEGLFLALAAGSLWAAWRGRPWLAAGTAVLAGALRLTGAGLVLPLLVLLPGRLKLLAGAPLLGLGAAAAVVWGRTGDPLALLHAQLSGRPHLHPGNPFLALVDPQAGGQWEVSVGLGFVAVLVVALVQLRRLEPWRLPAWATVAGLVGPALLAGTLFSLGRYLMVAFPLFWGLQRLPTRLLVGVGVPAALLVTVAAGDGRLTP